MLTHALNLARHFPVAVAILATPYVGWMVVASAWGLS